MELQQVEQWLALNAKKLPVENINEVKQMLQNLSDDKSAQLQALDLKDTTTMMLIAWLGGSLGIDRFMLGQTGLGVAKLLTMGGCGIWSLIDIFSASKRARQFNLEKLKSLIG